MPLAARRRPGSRSSTRTGLLSRESVHVCQSQRQSGEPSSDFSANSARCPRHDVSLSEFKYNRGTEIFGEAEPAEYIYQVIDGAVRSYKLLSDGRRQINAFHLSGDIFGLENRDAHRFTAEAIVDTTVRLVKRASLTHVAETDATVARDLLNMTATNLQHAEDHMLLLGRKTSLERVAAFLLEMDRRLTAAGIMALPMCRRDIADYLGLTLETVSRALSALHDKGILGFHRPDPAADRAARPAEARRARPLGRDVRQSRSALDRRMVQDRLAQHLEDHRRRPAEQQYAVHRRHRTEQTPLPRPA